MEIKISPVALLAVLGTLLAVIAAIVAGMLPELRRYMSIRSM